MTIVNGGDKHRWQGCVPCGWQKIWIWVPGYKSVMDKNGTGDHWLDKCHMFQTVLEFIDRWVGYMSDMDKRVVNMVVTWICWMRDQTNWHTNVPNVVMDTLYSICVWHQQVTLWFQDPGTDVFPCQHGWCSPIYVNQMTIVNGKDVCRRLYMGWHMDCRECVSVPGQLCNMLTVLKFHWHMTYHHMIKVETDVS